MRTTVVLQRSWTKCIHQFAHVFFLDLSTQRAFNQDRIQAKTAVVVLFWCATHDKWLPGQSDRSSQCHWASVCKTKQINQKKKKKHKKRKQLTHSRCLTTQSPIEQICVHDRLILSYYWSELSLARTGGRESQRWWSVHLQVTTALLGGVFVVRG